MALDHEAIYKMARQSCHYVDDGLGAFDKDGVLSHLIKLI